MADVPSTDDEGGRAPVPPWALRAAAEFYAEGLRRLWAQQAAEQARQGEQP